MDGSELSFGGRGGIGGTIISTDCVGEENWAGIFGGGFGSVKIMIPGQDRRGDVAGDVPRRCCGGLPSAVCDRAGGVLYGPDSLTVTDAVAAFKMPTTGVLASLEMLISVSFPSLEALASGALTSLEMPTMGFLTSFETFVLGFLTSLSGATGAKSCRVVGGASYRGDRRRISSAPGDGWADDVIASDAVAVLDDEASVTGCSILPGSTAMETGGVAISLRFRFCDWFRISSGEAVLVLGDSTRLDA